MTTTQSLEAQVDALTAQLRDAERLVRVQAHELARLRLNRQQRQKPICERCGALWPSVPEADACAVRHGGQLRVWGGNNTRFVPFDAE